ncbi:MAG: hypothetical protein ACJ8IR_05255 [Alphaproteobacteria bacterium]
MAVVVEELGTAGDGFRHRFSWSSTFAGAVVGTAATLFLLLLGAGVGLSLVPARGVASPTFLTLGAIYFLAAQAMGFAAAGHIVGRLIGPMAETDREEEFRAAAHGLAVWGVCVTGSVVLALLSNWGPVGSSVVADNMRLAPVAGSGISAPSSAAYWTDVLFRPPPSPMHAAVFMRYAQASNTATDATSPPDDEAPTTLDPGTAKPMTAVPSGSEKTETVAPETAVGASPPAHMTAAPHVITIPVDADQNLGSPNAPAAQPEGMASPADKAEVGRILGTWSSGTAKLPSGDRDRTVQLVSRAVGISSADAQRRVKDVETRVRSDQTIRVETARKIARNASLWIALALLFGAIVATMAAISARWEDDRITFGWRNRSSDSV